MNKQQFFMFLNKLDLDGRDPMYTTKIEMIIPDWIRKIKQSGEISKYDVRDFCQKINLNKDEQEKVKKLSEFLNSNLNIIKTL